MFENLSERLDKIFKKLKGHGHLREEYIDQTLKEVKLALLEADVNYKVVKTFLNRLKKKALRQEIMRSLTPAQQVIKIVRDELAILMGGREAELELRGAPTVIMITGLQGSGKTTTCAKLAKFIKEKRQAKPYLVPADIYRPAAIFQLQKLGEQLGIMVYPSQISQKPLDICIDAIGKARQTGHDTVIIDTAGRLHINEKMMDELKQLKASLRPGEIILVADAMTGQDAVNIAKTFNETLDITGVILTKIEGDARGGAALSIKAVTQKPIKFVGLGEKLDALEVFYPDRIASRILGMGDILSLIEKAEKAIDANKAKELQRKLTKVEFSLEDFRDQLQQIRKMGSLEQILAMIPGFAQIKQFKKLHIDESDLVRTEAIINSMTKQERLRPEVINGSRRKRIARGSGVSVQEINKLLKRYMQTKKMIKGFTKKDKWGKRAQLRNILS
jgi:signal recognition particle subunit SRP54